MKKVFISAALAVSLCAPAYAAQFTNTGDDIYSNPIVDNETTYDSDVVKGEEPTTEKVKTKDSKEVEQVLPIFLSADHAEYDSVSGDFHATGNVKLSQGTDSLMTVEVVGNMKTGDVYLQQGGTLVNKDTKMNGKWVHYNFNNKTGEIREITGSGKKDFYTAPHASIYPDRMVIDEGGTMNRCPAVKNPPCLSVKAKTFEIYPQEKMIARDVQVFIRGVHVYSRDRWVNTLNDDHKTRIMPRIGYDGKDNGSYVKLDVQVPVTDKTSVGTMQTRYSKVGYKPYYYLSHDERNFSVKYFHGWDEDDDTWYKKQNTWRFNYKNHHIIDGLPLSYSGYFEYGLWNKWNPKNGKSGPKSWHKEYAVYLNHDPIYLFNSKNTVLNLTVGKKWVNESLTGDTVSTDMYYATLGQKLGAKWRTWVGYYHENKTSRLFDLGQPDMDRELRNGISYSPDARNYFSVINRYDLDLNQNYETIYSWRHKFCCWALEFTYEDEQKENDNSFKVKYYFFNL